MQSNKYIFHLSSVSTCFGQYIAHHQGSIKCTKSAYGVRPVISNSMWYKYALILAYGCDNKLGSWFANF